MKKYKEFSAMRNQLNLDKIGKLNKKWIIIKKKIRVSKEHAIQEEMIMQCYN